MGVREMHARRPLARLKIVCEFRLTVANLATAMRSLSGLGYGGDEAHWKRGAGKMQAMFARLQNGKLLLLLCPLKAQLFLLALPLLLYHITFSSSL